MGIRCLGSVAVGLMVLALAPVAALAQERAVDALAMSRRIDQLISAQWQAKGAKPAPLSSDAEYFRRLSLDLNGRIPTLIQLRDFLDDQRPDKRRIWADILMENGRSDDPKDNSYLYINHFATYWRTLIFAQTTNQQAQFIGFNLDPWLRRQVKDNTPYDQIVRELLSTPQGQAFFQANENRPENIAGNAARLFLGVKLECAQCHDDRSGGSWTREQFWETAAFFTSVQPTTGRGQVGEIKIPEKNTVVKARFLDGAQPQFKSGVAPQATFAEWLTTAENPFFARALANRMWYYFLGTGIVDPVDFMSVDDNPPSHPELLEELAYQFAAHKFDLKFLIRAITGSQAYQLSSVKTHDSQDDTRLFARMAVRGMSPEQLFDSVLLATGASGNFPVAPNRFAGFQGNPRAEFVAKFLNTNDRRTETQTSILQSLYLMNNKFINDSITAPNGHLAHTIEAGPQVSTVRRIQGLYLVALSRPPDALELDRLVKYVDQGGTENDPKKALADIFWALLNSTEFLLNH